MIQVNRLHQISRSMEYTRRREVVHVAEIQHLGLVTHRILKDKDLFILESKIKSQLYKWDEIWSRLDDRERRDAEKSANQSLANDFSLEASEKLKEIENILLYTLDKDDTVDWDTLKNSREFDEVNPKNYLSSELKKIPVPVLGDLKTIPMAPVKDQFTPSLGFWDKVFPFLKQRKIDKGVSSFNIYYERWESIYQELDAFNKVVDDKYNEDLVKYEDTRKRVAAEYDDLERDWHVREKQYYEDRTTTNEKVEQLKRLYLAGDPESVLEYCEIVLNNSNYPSSFPKDFELEYNPETKLLIVEYTLPSPDCLPKVSEVKYIAAKKELKEYFYSEVLLAKLYDTTIYRIALRTVHELFEADAVNAIDLIVFNGWVEAVNKSNGKMARSCIVSMQVAKSGFNEVDLAYVDPKACFKSFKGVGSSKLSGITAVQPLIQVSKNDKRFISSHEVSSVLDDSYNLAAMNWEDFEHLLRELFEKEFQSNGGEVKVTRASRDGGVDAIAFDPDPIRGGKIVIQAKRYTNTVGVSSVRDLYGTVMNEGATKGILVTTADYGPDAYEFAKNKPLTLLNGNNLLFLLEKHGHKARIDLVEAKKMLGQSK